MLTLISGPALPIVSVQEAKAHCRVDGSDEDMLIQTLIAAATGHLNGYVGILGRAIGAQTWELTLDRFPAEIELGLGPVQSVTSIIYTDESGTDQTLDPGQYDVSFTRGLIAPVPGAAWPEHARKYDCIRVRFVTVADVPEPVRQAVLLMVGHWFNEREATSAATLSEIPMGVHSLLAPYRVSVV